MYSYEPIMFHKAYPLESFLEESKMIEKEKELMMSYLPKEYKELQRIVDETCDRMEYDGSRMYDEHPDKGVIYQMAKKICVQIEKKDEYYEDIACCFLCNEMMRRRYRHWKSRKYIR